MKLEEIYQYLLMKIPSGKINYAIPKLWIPKNFEGNLKIYKDVFLVNPYEYFSKVIENIIKKRKENIDYSKSLAQINGEVSSKWIKSATIYSAHVRMTAAFIHNADDIFKPDDDLGYRESGTFLKMIALLPYIKSLNANVVYFLPVTQSSDMFKKGEVGSPYAVKSFFHLDKAYHDPLMDGWTVEDQFQAFVEAAHILGIRVMLDFIPRTAARDNYLILDHPEWFYWIDIRELPHYKVPKIPELGMRIASPEIMEKVYESEEVKAHLKRFRWAPNITDPQRWENFKKVNENNAEFMEELIREFKVVTAPAFSDWINDPQPPWEDVTYLRLYLSHPKEALKYLENPEAQPPYILFDVAKASVFDAEKKNEELWELIKNIIPHFQKKYGIDGARLDMGHALPKELERGIMERVREIDPAFAMIAEELVMDNHEKAKESGYDAILGNSWWTEARYEESYMVKTVREIYPKLSIPAYASSETPDTPRAVTRKGGKQYAKLTAVLNTFLPNGITFINSGYELFESQPMNLGLDFKNPHEEKYKFLPPTDPFYGKLAFFDYYVLHWNNENMVDLISKLNKIREEKKELLMDSRNYRFVQLNEKAFGIIWWNGKEGLMVLFNIDFQRSVVVNVDLGYFTWKPEHILISHIENYKESNTEIRTGAIFEVMLNPGESKVYSFK